MKRNFTIKSIVLALPVLIVLGWANAARQHAFEAKPESQRRPAQARALPVSPAVSASNIETETKSRVPAFSPESPAAAVHPVQSVASTVPAVGPIRVAPERTATLEDAFLAEVRTRQSAPPGQAQAGGAPQAETPGQSEAAAVFGGLTPTVERPSELVAPLPEATMVALDKIEDAVMASPSKTSSPQTLALTPEAPIQSESPLYTDTDDNLDLRFQARDRMIGRIGEQAYRAYEVTDALANLRENTAATGQQP